MATIGWRKRTVAVLVVLATIVPVGIVAAAAPTTASAEKPTDHEQACPSGPSGGTRGNHDRAAASTRASGAFGQVVTVEVPPGALYLEPERAVVRVPAHGGPVRMDPVLVADLRADKLGWELTARIVEVRNEPDGSTAGLHIGLQGLRPIVGCRAGVASHGAARLLADSEAVLAAARPGHGWGSYVATPRMQLNGPQHGESTDIEVVVEYQLRSAPLG